MSLAQVEAAAAARDKAQDTLKEACAGARADGASVSDIARAAGATRQTIYRWLGEVPYYPVATVLSDGLRVLAEIVSPYTAEKLQKGIEAEDIHTKIGRLDLGMKNITREELASLTKPKMTAVSRAIFAKSAWLDAAKQGRELAHVRIEDQNLPWLGAVR